jgi:hypothetical protein
MSGFKRSASLAIRAKGIEMFDLMRKPVRQQAVKLPVVMVVVRKVCYVLAQKGDPTKTKPQ